MRKNSPRHPYTGAEELQSFARWFPVLCTGWYQSTVGATRGCIVCGVCSVNLSLSIINSIYIAQFYTPGTDIMFLMHCISPLCFSFFHFKTASSIQGGENFSVQIQINRHKCSYKEVSTRKVDCHIPWIAMNTLSFTPLFPNSSRLGAGCERASCLILAATWQRFRSQHSSISYLSGRCQVNPQQRTHVIQFLTTYRVLQEPWGKLRDCNWGG